MLHEILNDVYKSGKPGVVFKVDFEKAYDKINWRFLESVMSQKGFSLQWIRCMMGFVCGGKVAVKVNHKVGPFFRTYQGVRQGDPLSPVLFNFAVDGLSALVKSAQQQGLIKGLVPHLIPGGCAILQHADDTIFLLDADLASARILNLCSVCLNIRLVSRLIFIKVICTVWIMLVN